MSLSMRPFAFVKSVLRRRLNYTFRLAINGRIFTIPVVYGIGRQNLDNLHDDVYLVLQHLYSPGTLLVDVGANVGQTLLQWYALGDKSSRYVGLDINVQCAAYVEHLINLNGLANATVLPVGLGDSLRLDNLYLTGNPTGVDPAASINTNLRTSDFYSSKKTVLILPAAKLLPAIAANASVVIVKIDVEGLELEIIESMHSWLASTPCDVTFIVEILPPSDFSDQNNQYRLDLHSEIFNLFDSLGYHGVSAHSYLGLTQTTTPCRDFIFRKR